ncbi:MAG: carboxypeptidase-like regulatory domain-containing protein [Gemmatimonadaceae bacterium]
MILLAIGIIALPISSSAAVRASVDTTQRVSGVVRDSTSKPIAGAVVSITIAPTRRTVQDSTDGFGHFSSFITNSSGDFLVHVAATGFESQRRRVTVPVTQQNVTADFVLHANTVALSAVHVTARRPLPPKWRAVGKDFSNAETDATGGLVVTQPVNGSIDAGFLQLLPGAVGDGVRGPSFLGLGTDQNSTTLGGSAAGAISLPSFGRVQARAITSTYDPALGGFSGANIAFDVLPGGEFTTRKLDMGVNPPASAGEAPSVQATAAIDGPFGRTEYRGDAAITGSYQSFAAPSLFAPGGGTPAALAIDGTTRASLRNALSSLGAPSVSINSPGNVSRSDLSSVFRVDRSPYSRSSAGALLQFAASRQTGVGLNPGAAGSQAMTAKTTGAVLQLFTSEFTKSRALHETRLTAYQDRSTTDPLWLFPAISVLVPPSTGSTSLRSVGLGGVPSGYIDVTSGIELRREHQMIVGGNKHRLKYGATINLTGSRVGDGNAVQHTFAYKSLGALESNAPNFATMSSNEGLWREQSYGASAWFGDTWSQSKTMQVLMGGRIDADFAKLTSSDLVRSIADQRPALRDVTVSPRIGFRWIKWGPRFHISQEPLGLFPSQTPNLFRGGIGLFRSSWPSASTLSQLTQSSALLASRMECINPTTGPDWSAVDGGNADPGCDASLSSPFRATGANVSSSYKPARSVRASVGWSRPTKRLVVSADATLSLNIDQPDWVDRQFSGNPVFNLANGRPVYVSASSIDASSGAFPQRDVAPRQAVHLNSLESDARSLSRQVTLELQSPRVFPRPFWALTYVLSRTTGRMQGFQGTTAGNPLDFSNGPTSNDVRHQLVMMGGMYGPRALALSAYVKVRSGLPYTPIVGGDVNGDGFINDRAFSDPAIPVAGDKAAVACLQSAAGRMVGTNGCRGPWQALAMVRLDAQGQSLHLSQRTTISLVVDNPLAAVNSAHWAGAASVDPIAYYVTGFSATKQAFALGPNAHFGRPSYVQNPIVSFQVSIDLSKPTDEQMFGRSIEDASRHTGSETERVAAIQARYSRSVPDVYQEIREESDSLFLSRAQFDSLGSADIPYRARMDSVWHVLAEVIVINSDNRTSAELLEFSRASSDSAEAITMRERPLIRGILSSSQMPYLSQFITDFMNGKSIRMYFSQ